MKVLFLFLDMYRADSLKAYNESLNSASEIESIFSELGGCIELERYTEGPDTPRSMSSFYTGMSPWVNGCDERSKWPKFFLESNDNIFFDFQSNGYEIYTCINKYRMDIGLLPPLSKNVVNFETLDSFFKSKADIFGGKNAVYFLDIDDYHSAIDDYAGNALSHAIGDRKTCNTIKKIFKEIDWRIFDLIYIFSDHGCCLSSDESTNFEFIGPKRAKVLSFVHKKGDIGLSRNNTRCTMSDFRNSLTIGQDDISYSIKSYSDKIIIEDYRSLSYTSDKPNLWKVMDGHYSLIATKYNSILYRNNKSIDDPCKKKILEDFLNNSCCSYAVQRKIFKIEEFYSKLKANRDYYLDGTKRLGRIGRFKFKLLRKLSDILFH